MKLLKIIIPFVSLFFLTAGIAQENVFLSRDYWKANPSIEKIETDIAAGNDVTMLNSNMFDAVAYALLTETDNKIVKHLLTKKGNDVNKITHDGRTYMFWAAYRNNLEIMEHLVAKGAKANVKDSHGFTVINFAARAGQTNTKLYDFLLEHDADINDTNNNAANALLLVASSVTDYSTFEYFNKKGLDLKSTDDNGNGLFNYTARGGNVDLLKKLVTKGFPYKMLNKLEGNAVLMASQAVDKLKDGLATFNYLEGLGLEPNITNNEGTNPLHAIASKSDDLSILKYFIDKGVDVNQQNKEGITPFMNATKNNDLAIIIFLADHVKDLNTVDKNGRTALTMAINKNNVQVIEFLLKNGADSKIIDKKGNSLAYYLVNSYNPKKPEVFEAKLKSLQEKGLNLTQEQNNGNTLVQLAVQENNIALLKRLEEFKIDVNHKNEDGNTALHLAAMSGQNETILKYLIAHGADKSIKTEFEESVYDLVSENEQLKEQLSSFDYLK